MPNLPAVSAKVAALPTFVPSAGMIFCVGSTGPYVKRRDVLDALDATTEQLAREMSELEGIAKGLRDLDWCIGYALTPEQCVELDKLRDRAFKVKEPPHA